MVRVWFLGALVLAAASGCGRRSDDVPRATISGTVTYQGQPVVSGQIRFVPTGTPPRPVNGTVIREGKYQAALWGGVPVGACRVEIEAWRLIPNASADRLGGGKPPAEQFLPAKYNEKSELTLTIKPGSGAITQDYDLK